MPGGPVTVSLLGPEAARAAGETVSALYREVFSRPPFLGTGEEFELQRSSFEELTRRPGFQLAVARDAGRYVGFAYGFPLPPDTTWWDGVPDLPADFTAETGTRTFALLDFGVLPAYRGTGVGRELHDRVLSASGAPRATLTVQVQAADTQAVYQHWGWQRVGPRPGFLGGVPVTFDVYLLPSTSQPCGAQD